MSALGVSLLMAAWGLGAIPESSTPIVDESALGLVNSAVECRLTGKHVCATRDDALGFVEDALPGTEVLRVDRRPDGNVTADVLRSEVQASSAAVFSYVLNGKGQVLERACRRQPLELGMPIHALSPALRPRVLDGFLYVEDACDATGQCGNSPSMRYRITSRDARIERVDREELRGKASSSTSRGRYGACIFTTASTPVPKGVVPRVTHVSGWVSRKPGGPRLEPGTRLTDDQPLFLAPWARLEVAFGALRVQFGGLSEPTRLELVPNAELAIAWPAIEKTAAEEKTNELGWISDRYLRIKEGLHRLREGKLEFVCSLNSLDARWSPTIVPGTPAMFEDGHFVIAFQNTAFAGRCLKETEPATLE